jgi:hypothetical protein
MSGPCPMCDGEHNGKWNYCDSCLESIEKEGFLKS